MTFTARSGAAGSTFTVALAGVAARAIGHFATALKNRRAVRSLHELDDRALKDIGLVRTDIDAALGQPLHLDPSRHLVEMTRGGIPHGAPAGVVSASGMMRLRRHDETVTRPVPPNAACA
jgi:uncharacterized protein YjiS (DUF1127 family)